MIPSILKIPLRPLRHAYLAWRAEHYIMARAMRDGGLPPCNFDFGLFKSNITEFVQSLRTDDSGLRYRYARSCTHTTLYASVYACMTLSLLGSLQSTSEARKDAWAEYFDGFQNGEDGLFYDPVVMNKAYPDSDWWGARHLTMHMLSAYTDLGVRPRHPFRYLGKYYVPAYMKAWLDGFDWAGESLGAGDVDNRIMNIGCQLQFQRDAWADGGAAEAVDFLKGYLRGKINPATGMWGRFDTNDPGQRSRMVQFAYHLFPLYFYDGDFDFEHALILPHVLNTQNRFGGYGVRANSSACEDIDSIDLLIRFAPFVTPAVREEIERSLTRALAWVMLNQMDDGGFVFRLAEPFHYGSVQTSSRASESALLPTWFRTLSLAYLTEHLGLDQGFKITSAPGYEI